MYIYVTFYLNYSFKLKKKYWIFSGIYILGNDNEEDLWNVSLHFKEIIKKKQTMICT